MRGLVGKFVLIAAFVGLASCVVGPNYVKRGDNAAATGDWKGAVEMYQKALADKPNDVALRGKYDDARSKAIAQSLAIAKRCHAEHDLTCVDREATYVLQLDPTNAEAGTLQSDAHKAFALASVEKARQQTKQGEFLAAVRSLAEARTQSTDPEVAQAATAASQDMANPAITYVEARMQQPPADAEGQAQLYAECIEILHEVLQYVPSRSDLLAKAKAGYEAASAEIERRKQQEAAAKQAAADEAQRQQQVVAQEAERQRQAEIAKQQAIVAKDQSYADRTVMVVGAVIGPSKGDGSPWDPGGSGGPAVVKAVANAVLGNNPYTAVLTLLAGPIGRAIGKPDVYGTATMYVNGQVVSAAALVKNADNYMPNWPNVQWFHVDLRASEIRVDLSDADFGSADDAIAGVVITSKQLKQAADDGGVENIPFFDTTSNQLLFLRISVI